MQYASVVYSEYFVTVHPGDGMLGGGIELMKELNLMTRRYLNKVSPNGTGLPCSVSRPTAQRPPAAIQTTPSENRRQHVKQYWPIR